MSEQVALFLDRDGVINVDTGYVHDCKEWVFMEGIFEVLSYFKQRGFLLLLITNQSGIHRRYYTYDDFCSLTLFMQQCFINRLGFGLDRIYFCPHTPLEECSCRKPKGGMIQEALQDFPALNLTRSLLIGDSWSDILAARSMGLGQAFLIGDGSAPHALLEHEHVITHLSHILKA